MAQLNVKHFNKILAHIRTDLKRLWMPAFGIKKGTDAAQEEEINKFASCGTACCFAGWSKLLSMPRAKWSGEFTEGGYLNIDATTERERLGLTASEQWMLFDGVGGTRKEQFSEVKDRLREIIAERVAAGETSAKRIRV